MTGWCSALLPKTLYKKFKQLECLQTPRFQPMHWILSRQPFSWKPDPALRQVGAALVEVQASRQSEPGSQCQRPTKRRNPWDCVLSSCRCGCSSTDLHQLGRELAAAPGPRPGSPSCLRGRYWNSPAKCLEHSRCHLGLAHGIRHGSFLQRRMSSPYLSNLDSDLTQTQVPRRRYPLSVALQAWMREWYSRLQLLLACGYLLELWSPQHGWCPEGQTPSKSTRFSAACQRAAAERKAPQNRRLQRN